MYSFNVRIFLRILPTVWMPLLVTLEVFVLSSILALILGTLLALARRSRFRPLSLVAAAYIAFIRATPLLVQIYFIYYGGAKIGIILSALVTGILILGLHEAGYIAEIVRAGIDSITVQQYEASDSLGFTFAQKMRFVILPQAFRAILPPLANQISYVVKDTSLLSVVGLSELIKFARVTQAETFSPPESFLPSIMSYLLIILSALYVSKHLETTWRKRGGA